MAVGLLLLFELAKYSMLGQFMGTEVYVGVFGVLFIVMGIVIGRRFRKPAPLAPGNVVEADPERAAEIGLSPREQEVLGQIAQGKSNKEIAETLFVSESTIKSHVSNLLVKLDARRRTEAVRKAQDVGLLPK